MHSKVPKQSQVGLLQRKLHLFVFWQMNTFVSQVNVTWKCQVAVDMIYKLLEVLVANHPQTIGHGKPEN